MSFIHLYNKMAGLAFSPLTPVLVLLLGALLIFALGSILPSLGRDALAVLIIGAAGASLFALKGMATGGAIISSWPSPPSLGGGWVYRIDALAWLFVLAMSFVNLAIILASPNSSALAPARWAYFRSAQLILLAAGLSFAFSANLITLCLSWGFLDLALFLLIAAGSREPFTAEAAGRALVVNYLAGLTLLGGALLLREDGRISLSSGFSSASALWLPLSAALVRAGLYPAHLWLPVRGLVDSEARSLLYTVPSSTGLYLLVRLAALSSEGLPQVGALLALGGAALIIGAVLAWGERDGWRALYFVALNRIGYIVASTALAGTQAVTVVVGSVINLFVSLVLLFLGRSQWEEVGSRWLTLWLKALPGIAIASLIGFPLTLGFSGRWSFYRALLPELNMPLLITSVLADAVLCAALLRIWPNLGADARPMRWDVVIPYLAGMTPLALSLLILGVHPPLLVSLVAPLNGGPTFAPLLDLLSSVDVPLLAAVLLPPLGGYLLHRWQPTALDEFGWLWKGMGNVLCLGWLYRLIGRIGLGIGVVMRGVVAMIEGEHYLSWTILLAIVALFLLLGG